MDSCIRITLDATNHLFLLGWWKTEENNMTIYEYGDRSKPHILLIHGMWMIHEMMLPYVDKLRDDYHIIAPDLTGHGSDTGRFESAQKEASEIVDWLVQNQMTELALVFGASLGGVIAMDVISNETVLHTHCAVMEGASLTRVRGVEWLFRAMFCAMKKHPETIANMYASLPELDEDAGRMLSDTMARTDKEMLSNLVHSCNSYSFETRPLSPELQRHLFFEFGSKDSHLVCRKSIKKYYPGAKIITRKGYGHCEYMFTHSDQYAELLKSYMEEK